MPTFNAAMFKLLLKISLVDRAIACCGLEFTTLACFCNRFFSIS
jgi:hypothetical protein